MKACSFIGGNFIHNYKKIYIFTLSFIFSKGLQYLLPITNIKYCTHKGLHISVNFIKGCRNKTYFMLTYKRLNVIIVNLTFQNLKKYLLSGLYIKLINELK